MEGETASGHPPGDMEGETASGHPPGPSPSGQDTGVPPFQLQEITLGQLAKLMRRYKGGKALGGDNLGGNLLMLAATTNLPALLHVVNLSIREGRFCTRWKFHLVIPHHKKGERQSPDNYRPVCHLIY